MADVVIDNPILNPPFDPPTRHWRFGPDGITDEWVEGRRPSGYFAPVPAAKGVQLSLLDDPALSRLQANELVNTIRHRVQLWRDQGRPHITSTTRALIDYWIDPERERRLFFAQVEAAETAIYLAEAADRSGDTWLWRRLEAHAAESNPGLVRKALKMATGSGKTTVMGMLLAWQVCNSVVGRSTLFTDRFLVVTPGITVKDRLGVLLPSDPGNVYRDRDLVPAELMPALRTAKVVVTNYHAFGLRETAEGRAASKTTKQVLDPSGTSRAFTESPAQMVQRVCRGLGTGRRQVVVFNDEAHHCYRRRVDAQVPAPKLTGEDRREAAARDDAARMWLTGLLHVQAKLGIKATYDLSATPFFLAGSGYPEGALFPWVVSDFSLVDAIESGLVKIPRVPVADNSVKPAGPTYRWFWPAIRDALPKRGGRKPVVAAAGPPALPLELDGALRSLYDDYRRAYQAWQADAGPDSTPPVFIVVCNNILTSQLVFDAVAGYETQVDGHPVLQAGDFPLFTNVTEAGARSTRPPSILVNSAEVESGGGMSTEFRAAAAAEIGELKVELRDRFPGRDTDELTDEALLREVLNTVGRNGRLGEHIRCVVSVSMLTEGWDANTVTHILGVRAFGTQLLCEQVVGRGLRRRSYATGQDGLLLPEYAEVYGVPFSFIPGSGRPDEAPPEPKPTTRVRAVPGRDELVIRFPVVVGYRRELFDERLSASFDESADLTLSVADVPTETTVRGLIGEADIHDMSELRRQRTQQVAFQLARRVLDTELRDGVGNQRPWYFPQLVPIVTEWMREHVDYKDETFPGLLLLTQHANDAAARIAGGLQTQPGNRRSQWQPVLRPFDPEGSTAGVDFVTAKPVYATDPRRSQISHVVQDSGWEGKVADVLERLETIAAYAKNDHLGFTVPYTIDGEQRSYVPDFLVRVRVPEGEEPLTVVVEVSGAQRRDKTEKVRRMRDLWLPAVQAHGGFGRWRFVEVTDPYDCRDQLEAALAVDRDAAEV